MIETIGEPIRPITDDTKIYKYMSLPAFIYLRELLHLPIMKVSSWKDCKEGFAFSFLKKFKKESDDPHKESELNEFFGSSWTLGREPDVAGFNVNMAQKAEEDIAKNESGLMWESYCAGGGVRIRSTIGKLDKLFKESFPGDKMYRGEVRYMPSGAIQAKDLVEGFFCKTTPFRTESEYRYIVHSKSNTERLKIMLSLGSSDIFRLVEEILISPSTAKWDTRAIYHYGLKPATVS